MFIGIVARIYGGCGGDCLLLLHPEGIDARRSLFALSNPMLVTVAVYLSALYRQSAYVTLYESL